MSAAATAASETAAGAPAEGIIDRGLLFPQLNGPDVSGLDWRGAVARRRDQGGLDPLRLRVPGGPIDPLGSAALRALERDLNHKPDALRRELSRRGLTTEVLALSKRLDATHMSDVRRHVLARSYASILAGLLGLKRAAADVGDGDGSGNTEGDGAVRVDLTVTDPSVDFADTSGAVTEVLAALEADGGPLETFVRYLVGGILKKTRRDTSDEMVIGLVVGEVLATV